MKMSFLSSVTNVAGSHACLGFLALASLPLIARHLGPAVYGRFSLFLLLVALVWAFDFARPLLMYRYAESEGDKHRDLERLAAANVWLSLAIVSSLGYVLLGPTEALALAAIALVQTASTPAYASAALAGRVATLHIARNFVWGGAYVAVAVTSSWSDSTLAFALPFAIASIVTSVIWLHIGGYKRIPKFWIVWRSSIADHALLRNAISIEIFNLAASAVSSIDKLWMRLTLGGRDLGQYMAQSDLAIKANMIGTAIGHVLYPLFAREVRQVSLNRATEHFARIFILVMLGYGTVILGLILLSRPIIALFFGQQFLSHQNLYAMFLVGVFLQMIGFLVTPWQRARGEFVVSRNAYLFAIIAMTLVGTIAIPRYGMLGGALVYLAGRTADVTLLINEWRLLRECLIVRRTAPALALLFFAMVWGALEQTYK